jgi:ankyrin repeat protein
VENGNPDILQLFLDNADNVHDEGGNTPMQRKKVSSRLLRLDADRLPESHLPHCISRLLLDYNAQCTITQETPLHFAAEHGLLEVAQILLERKADVNSQNNHGSTPLLLASEFGHPDVVQLLLDHNADLSVRDADGDTPLHCAAVGGQLEVARILLKLNVEVNSERRRDRPHYT